MKEEVEIWRAETIRVGDVEISILLDMDTGAILEDTEHMIFFDKKENKSFAAYGIIDIYKFMASLNEEEHKMWISDAHKAIKYALKANWI